jgi:ankyrin repeat protein
MHRLASVVLVGLLASGLFGVVALPSAVAQSSFQEELRAEMDRQLDWKHATPQEALMAAASLGNKTQVERALKRGANINQIEPLIGYTALIHAAQLPSMDLIKFMLSKGADVNERSSPGAQLRLPLRLTRHVMGRKPKSIEDEMSLPESTLEYMQSVPQHWLSFRPEGGGVTPLIAAAATGSAIKVKYLLDKGANPNLATYSGETPLMAAAYTGYLPAVEALLKAGAKINHTNNRGASALTFAVLEGRTDVARTLLHHGANSDLTFDGLTLPQIAKGFHYANLPRLLEQHITWQKRTAKLTKTTPAKPAMQREPVRIINADGSVEIAS